MRQGKLTDSRGTRTDRLEMHDSRWYNPARATVATSSQKGKTMSKRFRVLRFVAFLYKLIAWIVVIAAAFAAIVLVIVGALQGRAGAASPLLAPIPIVGQVSGLLMGLVSGLFILIVGLIQFVFIYAVNEVIHLALAIEDNTRKSAYYLSGEGAIPPPPPGVSWESTGADEADA